MDSSGIYGQTEFNGFREFRDLLAADNELLTKTFVEKLLTFATGRELGFSDRPEVQQIVDHAIREKAGIQDLFHLVIQSEVFRTK